MSLALEIRSPSLALLATEPVRAVLDLFAPRVGNEPKAIGDGHPVIVYPGLGAGPWSTARLRWSLAASGFAAHDWGFGQNRGPRGGDIAAYLERLCEAVEALSEREGRRVSLVGWSLGGIFAREVARAVPDAVRQVVSLGSPFAAPPGTTHASWAYRLLNGARPPESPRQQEELKRPLVVPSSSLYSKADGIVPWRGCLQKAGPNAENVEVPGVSHLGMGTNRTVLAIVAERLAQPEGSWKPRPSRR